MNPQGNLPPQPNEPTVKILNGSSLDVTLHQPNEASVKISDNSKLDVTLNNSGELSLKERWEMAKRVIEHEHSLLKTRATRFLTLQGFLFSMVVALISAYFYNESQNPWLYYAVFLSIVVAFILIIIYKVAKKSALNLIDASDLAKRQSYYASYWFYLWDKYLEYENKVVKEGLKVVEVPEKYWLDHHAEQKNVYGNKEFDEYLNEIEIYPNFDNTYIFKTKFKVFENNTKRETTQEGTAQEGTAQGGTAISYARLLMNAWEFIIIGILCALAVHILVSFCLYFNVSFNIFGFFPPDKKHGDIAPPRNIVVRKESGDNDTVVKPLELTLIHKDKTADNGTTVEPEKPTRPHVTFHLIENLTIDFRLEQSKKPDKQPFLFQDCIDGLLNVFRISDTLDESDTAQSIPETPEIDEIDEDETDETPETDGEESDE